MKLVHAKIGGTEEEEGSRTGTKIIAIEPINIEDPNAPLMSGAFLVSLSSVPVAGV